MRQNISRRRFVQTTGSMAGIFTIAGSTSASGKPINGTERVNDAQGDLYGEFKLGDNENGYNILTQDELRDHKDDLVEKHDLKMEEVNSLDGPDTSNLTFIDAANAGGDINSGQTGIKLGETDHNIRLFRGDETDADGQYIYYLYHWSLADPRDDFWVTASVDDMHNHADMRSSLVKVSDFTPDNDLTEEGQEYDLNLGVNYGGVNMGVSTTLEHGGGIIGPQTGNVQVGSQGEFSVMFEGYEEDRIIIKGVTELRFNFDSLEIDSWRIDWNPYTAMASGETGRIFTD